MSGFFFGMNLKLAYAFSIKFVIIATKASDRHKNKNIKKCSNGKQANILKR